MSGFFLGVSMQGSCRSCIGGSQKVHGFYNIFQGKGISIPNTMARIIKVGISRFDKQRK
jgi:hypothetical protein